MYIYLIKKKKDWKGNSFSAVKTMGSTVRLWCGIISFRCHKKSKSDLKPKKK